MLSQFLSIGDTIEIHLKNESGIKKYFLSSVEDILGDNRLLISMPISNGEIEVLSSELVYSFVFSSKGGMYVGDGRIIEHKKVKRNNYAVIEIISNVEKLQKRDFYRFKCTLPMKFTVLNHDGALLRSPSSRAMDGIILDLSGGGIRFVSNEILKNDDYIQCVFKLEKDYLLTSGKILRIHKSADSKFEYSAVFSDISPSVQDDIIHFIFYSERKKIQKNMV